MVDSQLYEPIASASVHLPPTLTSFLNPKSGPSAPIGAAPGTPDPLPQTQSAQQSPSRRALPSFQLGSTIQPLWSASTAVDYTVQPTMCLSMSWRTSTLHGVRAFVRWLVMRTRRDASSFKPLIMPISCALALDVVLAPGWPSTEPLVLASG